MMPPKMISAAAPTWAIVLIIGVSALPVGAQETRPAGNMMGNGSFEMGRQFWTLETADGTTAEFEVDSKDAADGGASAMVTIDAVGSWGVQFGQNLAAGVKGRTYTFATMVRSLSDPVNVSLQIERRGEPYDRAARTDNVAVKKDQWTEVHTTFKVEKDFKEGWFAYIACQQPKSRFRVDTVRLYEGEYVPFTDLRSKEAARAGTGLYDTGVSSATPLEPAAIGKKEGWQAVPEDKLDQAFGGDAVVVNNRLAVVLRRKGLGAEVYSLGTGSPVRQCVLRPASGGAGELASLKTVANNPGEVALEATYSVKDGNKPAMIFSLKMGQPFVQVQGGASVAAVRLEAPCRFAVMPDFFADDIVVDAAELSVAKAPLPAESFLMQMIEGGGAIVMAVWSARQDDIGIELSGQGPQRRIVAAEIPCGGKGKAWVAVLEGPGIWHRHDVAKADTDKVVAMDWTAPVQALWRVDWRRDDKLFDSWDMLVQQKAGGFLKQGVAGSSQTLPPDRKRWTTVLGTFQYPCWIDRDGRGQLQPLRSGALRFEGPALVYPLGRVPATPLDAFTAVDVVRSTLGVGPCEYVLDVEGQQARFKGRATCANRDTLDPIYESKQQKAKKAEIEKSLTEVMVFIRHIRGRIEEYVAFGHEIADYLDQQAKAHPELAKELRELKDLAGMVDRKVQSRRDHIKTPEQAQEMVDAFRRDGLEDEGPGAADRCKKFTAAIVDIGSNQDELVGECRWTVKVVRQRAALMLLADPQLAEVVREIRTCSQKVLRNPAGHEGAGH
jgi:hypothetical protein